ncbi:MAG: chemotaxis protein CheA [Deltaproteobacteria bacterium]|nr:chemotaxis protein CheA [Deltaproteobacteria bacterium]
MTSSLVGGIEDFLAEAQEIVDHLSSTLLAVDQGTKSGGVDPDLINTFFRHAHSLKGLAGMFGQTEVGGIAHHFENVLDALRLGRVRLDRDNLDLFYETIETFHAQLAAVAGGPAHGRDMDALTARLDAAERSKAPWQKSGLPRVPVEPAIAEVLSEYEEHRLRENLARGATLYDVRVAYEVTAIESGLSGMRERLKPVGEVIATLPNPIPGDDVRLEFRFIVGSVVPEANVAAALFGSGAVVSVLPLVTITPTASAATGAGAATEAGAGKGAAAANVGADPGVAAGAASAPPSAGDNVPISLRSVSQTVRVDIARLDSLMNIVGELVLAKAGILRVTERLKGEPELGHLAVELHREYRILDRRVAELREGLLEVRMVPLSTIFDKLTRVARSISRSAGKSVEVVVSGADTELDKLIVEELSDPLLHMLRNSIDHGIEAPETRAARGKPPAGRVELRAYQKGNHVVIEVADDGGGIDPDGIRKVALERGAVTQTRLAEMSARDLLNLIFLPGLSTKSEVSELSGRGVGLDVVKNNIAKLSGVIDIDSEPGRGTTFTITLPITLAILPALIVRSAGQVFAIPLSSVLESIAVDPSRLHRLAGREVVTLRGVTLPILRLAETFGFGPTRPITSAANTWYVVVVGIAELRLGILVEDLAGQQDVIIKSLGKMLSGARGIAGATELGNQEPVLVLDVAALVEEALRREVAA